MHMNRKLFLMNLKLKKHNIYKQCSDHAKEKIYDGRVMLLGGKSSTNTEG